MENVIDESHYPHLARELGLATSKIIELINGFQSDQVLVKQPDGRFHVMFDKLSHRLQQKNYQKQLLSIASSRVDTDYDSSTSLFTGYTFTATDESLIQLQIDLKSIMEKYMSMPHTEGQKCHIAQACFQIFPVIRSL